MPLCEIEWWVIIHHSLNQSPVSYILLTTAVYVPIKPLKTDLTHTNLTTGLKSIKDTKFIQMDFQAHNLYLIIKTPDTWQWYSRLESACLTCLTEDFSLEGNSVKATVPDQIFICSTWPSSDLRISNLLMAYCYLKLTLSTLRLHTQPQSALKAKVERSTGSSMVMPLRVQCWAQHCVLLQPPHTHLVHAHVTLQCIQKETLGLVFRLASSENG